MEPTEEAWVQDKIQTAIVGLALSVAVVIGGFPGARVWAYPGGPLRDVTDAAPYCAGCHSSVGVDQLRDLPANQAQKRTAAVAHLDAIKAGSDAYAKLTPDQRTQLIADVEKVDANSKISIEVPPTVKAGDKFTATVKAQGGSGPVFGVMLLDIDLRDQARAIQGEGFQIDTPPRTIGPDGKPQDQWLNRRYDSLAHNLNFVVVFGVKADLAAGKFSTASVTYDLVAPSKPGKYTICAALAYGTEKASPLGRVEMGGHPMPLGGFAGASGRILFSKAATIEVQ
jgi:cytochrome c553